MLGIAIRGIQHSQVGAWVCELAHSFFHLLRLGIENSQPYVHVSHGRSLIGRKCLPVR